MAWFRCRVWRDVGLVCVVALLAAATAQSRVCAAQAVTELRLPDSPGAVVQAPEQVKAEINQPPPDAFSNSYTSYQWDADPLSAKRKYRLALRSLADPLTFATVAAMSMVEQVDNTYPGYGSGWQGYGKRYATDLADKVSDRMLGGAVLPALLHQDPRYFYKGTGRVRTRLRYALGQALLCRGDNGRLQVNYSTIAGSFMAAGLSNAYRADVDRNASTTFVDAFVLLGEHMASNVIREFFLKRLTTGVPIYAGGKP
jgi:hypothetical protein